MNADVDFARLPACPTEVFDTMYSRTGLLRHRRDRINFHYKRHNRPARLSDSVVLHETYFTGTTMV